MLSSTWMMFCCNPRIGVMKQIGAFLIFSLFHLVWIFVLHKKMTNTLLIKKFYCMPFIFVRKCFCFGFFCFVLCQKWWVFLPLFFLKKELFCILNDFCLRTNLNRTLRPAFKTSKKYICVFIASQFVSYCLNDVNLNLIFRRHWKYANK